MVKKIKIKLKKMWGIPPKKNKFIRKLIRYIKIKDSIKLERNALINSFI